MKTNILNAQLAYVSACHPDESLNLAVITVFVGLNTLIATVY